MKSGGLHWSEGASTITYEAGVRHHGVTAFPVTFVRPISAADRTLCFAERHLKASTKASTFTCTLRGITYAIRLLCAYSQGASRLAHASPWCLHH